MEEVDGCTRDAAQEWGPARSKELITAIVAARGGGGQYCEYSSEGGSICGTLSCEDTEGTTGDVKITKNISQIEALIKRINDENKKTKEVLEKIDRKQTVAPALMTI